MSPSTLLKAKQEKIRGDAIIANQMCNQLLEEMNRVPNKERRMYKQVTFKSNDGLKSEQQSLHGLSKTVIGMKFSPAPA